MKQPNLDTMFMEMDDSEESAMLAGINNAKKPASKNNPFMTVVQKFNENHDELGRFAESDSSGSASSGGGSRGGASAGATPTIALPSKVGGMHNVPVDELPASLTSQIEIRDHKGAVREQVRIAIDNIKPALDKIGGTNGLDQFKQNLLDNVKVCVCDLTSEDNVGTSMMTTASKDGIYILINNVHDDTIYMSGSASHGPNGEPANVSIAAGDRILKAGGTMQEAVAAAARASFIHELGHVADITSGEALTANLWNIGLEKISSDPNKVQVYIGKNVSPYAATDPHEAAAEIFSLAMRGEPVPKAFEPLARMMRDE